MSTTKEKAELTLKKISDAKVLNNINEVNDVLTVLKNEEVDTTKIPIEYFSSTFAPKFDEMIKTGKNNINVIGEWLKISGGPYRPVDLIDNKGNIVDIVPPILSKVPSPDAKGNEVIKKELSNLNLKLNTINSGVISQSTTTATSLRKVASNIKLDKEKLNSDRKEFIRIVDKYKPELSKECIEEKLNQPTRKLRMVIE